MGEIADLEFGIHKNLKKNVFSFQSNELGQIYVKRYVEIQISLFGWKEKKCTNNTLYNGHQYDICVAHSCENQQCQLNISYDA